MAEAAAAVAATATAAIGAASPASPPSSSSLSSAFHAIPHVSNFREVTSLPIAIASASDSRLRTRPGLIYRSGAYPLPVPTSTLEALAALNIRAIYDLRSVPEVSRASHPNTQTVSAALTAQHRLGGQSGTPSSFSSTSFSSTASACSSSADSPAATVTPTTKTATGTISPPSAANANANATAIQRFHTPVFADIDYSPAALALRYRAYASPDGTAGFVQSYRRILSEGGAAFGEVCRRLLRRPDEPLLINCTAGKDRTGAAVALLLTVAGVGDEAVADEYALTAEGLAAEVEVWVPLLMKLEGLEGDEAGARRLLGSRRESMLAMLEMLRGEFGGVERYLMNKCGLAEAEVEKLRDCLRMKVERPE